MATPSQGIFDPPDREGLPMARSDKKAKIKFGSSTRIQRSRRIPALVLTVLALIMIFWIGSRDLEWKHNYETAMESGHWAFNAGNLEKARDNYSLALTFNPYSPDAHFALAEALNKNFGNNEDALKHYKAGLECDPDHPLAEEAMKAVAALEMIMAGIIEDPIDAAKDMATSARERSFAVFADRLGPNHLNHASMYWRAWLLRGPGELIQRRLVKTDDNNFEAVLGFSFADGTSMSMRFFCRAGEPWRLILSFP